LPFAILGFDFDNGSEWLNWALIRYLQVRAKPIWLTRSRPYHKDDNAHVEQKNWMWPRQLLGYGRLADPALVQPINALYKQVWGPLHNFFLPSMKLVKNGAKVVAGSVVTIDRKQLMSACWPANNYPLKRSEGCRITSSHWIRSRWLNKLNGILNPFSS